MVEVIKIKDVDKNTAFPTELVVAKLRAVNKYCSLSLNDICDRDIIRLSSDLADRIEGGVTMSANDFKNHLEGTLRERYDKEGQTYAEDVYCNVMRLYFIECIMPEILPNTLASEVRKIY